MADASYTSTGGMILGGPSASANVSYASSGGMILGGSSIHTVGREPNLISHISWGGMILGGTTTVHIKNDIESTSTGGIVCGGASSFMSIKSHTSTGGMILGGTTSVYANTPPPVITVEQPFKIVRAAHRSFVLRHIPANEELA